MNLSKHIIFLLLTVLMTVGCYENIDNTEIEQVAVDPPELTNDANINGIVLANDGTTLLDEYVVEANGVEYTIEGKQFNLDLTRVKKLHQAIYIKKAGEMIGFASQPLLPNELHYLVIQSFRDGGQAEIVQPSTSYALDEVLTLKLDGGPAFANGDTQLLWKKLENGSGNLAKAKDIGRVVVNHLNGYKFDILDESGATADKTYTGKLNINQGVENTPMAVFRYNAENEYWELHENVVTGQAEIEIELPGMYSLAEYAKAVVIEGNVAQQAALLGYADIEVKNSAFGTPYIQRSTASGKYLAFLEAGSEATMTLLTCSQAEAQTISAGSTDRSKVNLDYDAVAYEGNSLLPQIFDCDGDLVSNSFGNLTSDQDIYAIASLTSSNLPYCQGTTSTLTTTLDDGSQFDLPWDGSLSDSLIYLPSCQENASGYGYIKIKGDKKVYDQFAIETVNGNLIVTSGDASFRIVLRGIEKGNYSIEQVGLKIEDTTFGSAGYSVDCSSSIYGCGLDYCQVTHFDSEWFRVSFGGRVWMQTIAPRVAGNYEMRGNIVIKF